MKKLFPAIAIAALLAGCGQQKAEYIKLEGFALGTTYHFVLQARDTAGLRHDIDSVFGTADMSMSVYNPSSLVSRVNANQTDSVDRFIAHCISVAREISEISGGMYDITIKPVTQALGYSGGEIVENPNIDSLLQYVGYEKIEVRDGRLVKADPAMQIDLNSVAKGYTCDLMGEMLESRGIKNYMVEIGGEIYCRGKSSRGGDWIVAIDSPIEGNLEPGAYRQGALSLSGMGLATSGNYRQFYIDDSGRKVTHIVNAKTGQSGHSDVLSATVIAETCAEADAVATMLMIVGVDRAVWLLGQHPEWMAYLVYDGGEDGFVTYATDNLKDRIINN